MQSFEGLSEKEINRRKKISASMKKYIKKKREKGLKKYWARKRREKRSRELAEKKAKEKEKNKKKRGRHKKPGRKIDWNKRKRKKALAEKKRKEREAKKNIQIEYNYKIFLCRGGKRKNTIGEYETVQEAYDVFNEKKREANDVVFERMFKGGQTFRYMIDECIIVEKTDSGPSVMRNEYGKLVEHKTDLEGWEVLDKFQTKVEETFWVWGYDNRSDRKTFKWIFDEMIVRDGFGPYEYRRVFTYRNKLLIRYDDGTLGLIFCKCEYDATRMYNLLQQWAKRDGLKQVVFIGDRSDADAESRKVEKELSELTGWTIKKVQMRGTSYYIK